MPASSSPSPDSNEEGRLVQTARAAAALAEQLTTGVAVLAGLSAGAALLLWGVLWWPLSSHVLSLLGAAVTFALLLGPTAVLALFYQGLRDLLALPTRLSDRTTRTVEQSTDAFRSVTTETPSGLLGRLWDVVTHIWALRGVLLENRALLVRYGVLLRFVNPGFLLLVVGAIGATGLLVPGALFALVVAWIL
ncbi:hypothetical protein [Salinibacter altiplanensis]|uniref:hypothetical protein n=1 Tax=Salinibacter altiplanensis TaxID=1803181 RepID=UPI000C9F882B|nr:hypothetical protein [Salinibacter altiplanensis]